MESFDIVKSNQLQQKGKFTCVFHNLLDLCENKRQNTGKILCPRYGGQFEMIRNIKDSGRFEEILPLSASLSIISFNVASSLDTDLLIMPTQVSVGTLVSDQSLTVGGVLRAGKFFKETEHKKLLRNKLHNF